MGHGQTLCNKFCRCLDWGPDSFAVSCSWSRLVCWIGLAKLTEGGMSTVSTEANGGRAKSKGKERSSPQRLPVTPLKPWYLVLAYDGTDFAGWQKQSEAREGSQVCHFDAPEVLDGREGRLDNETLLRRLRLTLPPAIFAVKLGEAPASFHSRLSSEKKKYSYRLSTEFVMPFEARQCWTCGELDLHAMQTAINALHNKFMDYTAFTTGENEPEYHGPVTKTVQLELKIDDMKNVSISASSDRFLYKMVRRIVGALVEVGKGRLAASDIAAASRQQIPTAPPAGLTLLDSDVIEEEEEDEGSTDDSRHFSSLATLMWMLLHAEDTDEPETAEALSKLEPETLDPLDE
eukprot:Skav214620  [mRNA]  locus=scaffold961:46675:49408:- [translate_table: standard]